MQTQIQQLMSQLMCQLIIIYNIYQVMSSLSLEEASKDQCVEDYYQFCRGKITHRRRIQSILVSLHTFFQLPAQCLQALAMESAVKTFKMAIFSKRLIFRHHLSLSMISLLLLTKAVSNIYDLQFSIDYRHQLRACFFQQQHDTFAFIILT